MLYFCIIMNSILDQDIMFLPGVGPKKKEILSKELGINSYSDLLEYYPYKYVDRSKVFHISELNADMPFVQLKGKILSYDEIDTGKRNKLLVAHFSDGYGVADLIWYRGTQYIMKTYRVGTEYLVFGKPTVFNGRFQFTHPDMDDATESPDFRDGHAALLLAYREPEKTRLHLTFHREDDQAVGHHSSFSSRNAAQPYRRPSASGFARCRPSA